MNMKKAEYIEKYGEDAYKKYLAYLKEYRETHKDEMSTRKKEWYKLNKDHCKEKSKNRYEDNKDELKEYYKNRREEINRIRRTWYSNNKDRVQNQNRKWRDGNKEKVRAINLIKNYQIEDMRNNRGDCDLTSEWIINNVFLEQRCIYCGDSNWRHLGCDRIDNSKAHTTDNVVCSCGLCNVERQWKRMSVDEFVEYRRAHPRDNKPNKLQEIVEINGKKVIRKSL